MKEPKGTRNSLAICPKEEKKDRVPEKEFKLVIFFKRKLKKIKQNIARQCKEIRKILFCDMSEKFSKGPGQGWGSGLHKIHEIETTIKSLAAE